MSPDTLCWSVLKQDAEHYTGVDNRTQIYCNDFLSNAELLGLFISDYFYIYIYKKSHLAKTRLHKIMLNSNFS